MSERNDNRLVEDSGIAFAMYCDENGLDLQEGIALAERIYDELEMIASDREFQDVP
jgi:hypothetical protein